MYVGEGICPSFRLGLSSVVVLYLAKGILKNKKFKLYFDYWYTSVSLQGIQVFFLNIRLATANYFQKQNLKKPER